jgi:hypothetical protein
MDGEYSHCCGLDGKRIQRGKLTGHETDTGWTTDLIERRDALLREALERIPQMPLYVDSRIRAMATELSGTPLHLWACPGDLRARSEPACLSVLATGLEILVREFHRPGNFGLGQMVMTLGAD